MDSARRAGLPPGDWYGEYNSAGQRKHLKRQARRARRREARRETRRVASPVPLAPEARRRG